MARQIYTIGHSTHEVCDFIALLRQHSISAIGDVRSRPYSRANPQFNREALLAELKATGIAYVFLGKELGARSGDKNCYRDGRVDYELLARAELFKNGLQRVLTGAQKFRLALMCAERNPIECHRTILVSRELSKLGLDICHILASGITESQEDVTNSLIKKFDLLGNKDLFRSREEIVSEAYHLQGREIAYEEESDRKREQRKPTGQHVEQPLLKLAGRER